MAGPAPSVANPYHICLNDPARGRGFLHIFKSAFGPDLYLGEEAWYHILHGHGTQFGMKDQDIFRLLRQAIAEPDYVYRRDSREHAIIKLYRRFPTRKWVVIHFKIVNDGAYIKTAHPTTKNLHKLSIVREGDLVWPTPSLEFGQSRDLPV